MRVSPAAFAASSNRLSPQFSRGEYWMDLQNRGRLKHADRLLKERMAPEDFFVSRPAITPPSGQPLSLRH
jgi:hypothetical protein